ncbi:MAG: GPW/gp25 family protein [Endozoicomonas sp.]
MIEHFVHCYTHEDTQAIRESVVFALASLLSTRAYPGSVGEPNGLPGFGVPCWQTLSSDRESLCRILEKRIARYEKRLNRIQVSVDRAGGGLVFLIEGGVADSLNRNFQYKVSYPCHLRMT